MARVRRAARAEGLAGTGGTMKAKPRGYWYRHPVARIDHSELEWHSEWDGACSWKRWWETRWCASPAWPAWPGVKSNGYSGRTDAGGKFSPWRQGGSQPACGCADESLG